MPSPELSHLIAQAKGTAVREPDHVAILREAIKQAIASQADPYLTIGLMVEGVVSALLEQMPDACRCEVALATGQLFADRLAGAGII